MIFILKILRSTWYKNIMICSAKTRLGAALNKWLHQYVSEGCTMHSFRHSMRDRLRAVDCPSDVIDQIGGWATAGVGQGYGKGYELKVCANWMSLVAQK